MQLAKITKPIYEITESRHPSSVPLASMNVAISLLSSYVKMPVLNSRVYRCY